MRIFYWIRERYIIWVRMRRVRKWRCPYCNAYLVGKTSSGRTVLGRACPNKHYAIEISGRDTVTIHDNRGDPVALLFDRDFKLLKNEDREWKPQ